MAFTPVSKILPKTFAKFGLTRQARAALVCERYRKAALQLFPPKISLHAWPKCFRGKTLIIGVDHPAYANEIIQKKEQLLALLNDKKPLKFQITDIRTKVESPTAIGEDL